MDYKQFSPIIYTRSYGSMLFHQIIAGGYIIDMTCIREFRFYTLNLFERWEILSLIISDRVGITESLHNSS